MSDSARLQILKEVERLLNTVEGIRVVTRNVNDVISLPDYPAAIVQAGGETREPMLNEVDNVDWFVGVELWVKSESNLGDVQEDFLAKVEKLLGENTKLLGNKVHFHQQDGAQQWIPINEALTITGVMLTYLAKFKRHRNDPYLLA